MNKYNVKIYEAYISNEAFDKIREELDKNPNFVINNSNITEFVDCNFVLDILKKHKIKYKIITNDIWNFPGHIPDYNLTISIYVSQRDYILIKPFLEPEKTLNNDEFESEETTLTKRIDLFFYIFINLFFLAVGVPLFVLGIQFIMREDIPSAIFIMLMSIVILIPVIKTINKFMHNKFSKKL